MHNKYGNLNSITKDICQRLTGKNISCAKEKFLHLKILRLLDNNILWFEVSLIKIYCGDS